MILVAASLLAAGCSSGAATTGANARSRPASTPAHRHRPHRAERRHVRRHRAHAAGRRRAVRVPAVDMPDRALTPGAVLRTSVRRVCIPGYASRVRDVPESERSAVYARYGVADTPYAHEVDHLVSLEVGGSNAIANLWPEPYAGRWGARTKDVLEGRLHQLVCDGRLGLRRAQRIEARDWVAAYRRYVGGTPAAVRPAAPTGAAGSGGYYASSYPTASTIYCADDPDWRTLSSRYLVHFRTYAQAVARFPGYHLHRPC